MPRLYIAHPADDDEESLASRERLIAHLRQYDGIEILPTEPAVGISDDQITASLKAADLSVHFLGVSPGRCEEGPRGIVQRQFELAEELERARAGEGSVAREPRIVYLKSRRLCEVEETTFEPQEWEFGGSASGSGPRPGKELRGHLHFLCRVLLQVAPIKVFYSYARSDREHLEKLRRCLISSRRNGRILEWYDGLLDPGEDWNEETSIALDDCDVLVYLVSPESIASLYAYHKEYGRAKRLQKKIVSIAVSSTLLSGTGIDESQMVPIDEASRLRPVDEWSSVNKAWTSVAEQLQTFFDRCAKDLHSDRVSVPIEPCSDPGELKELLESRLRLRLEGRGRHRELAPMVFLDWMRRPEGNRSLERIKSHLASRCRVSCALSDMANPRDESYAASMYGISDAVVIFCDDRRPESAAKLQQWLWQVERRRRAVDDRPKCIAVLDLAKGGDGKARQDFAESFPNGETVMVLGTDVGEPESLFEPLWRRIGA